MRPVLRAHLRALSAGKWMDELSSFRPCGHSGPRCGWALSSSLSIIPEILRKATKTVRDSAQIYWSVFVHYHHSRLFPVLSAFFSHVFVCLCVSFCRQRSCVSRPNFNSSRSNRLFQPSAFFSVFRLKKPYFFFICPTFSPFQLFSLSFLLFVPARLTGLISRALISMHAFFLWSRGGVALHEAQRRSAAARPALLR